MIIKNVSGEDLSRALAIVSKKYNNNVIWNNYQREGRNFRVTLRVVDSHGRGARLAFPDPETGKQRRMISACWHVHGDFFEALLEINPNAEIRTSKTKIYTQPTLNPKRFLIIGNWEDWNIGSIIHPFYFSEACGCQ